MQQNNQNGINVAFLLSSAIKEIGFDHDAQLIIT